MDDPRLVADAFRLLGDDVRLRLLRLLGRERLNVSELTRILGVAQSSVSRHVRLLREGGFVAEARESGWTWLVLADEPPPGLDGAWAAVRDRLEAAGDPHGDDARLAEVRRARAERRVGWGSATAEGEPGRSWAAWARALGHLLPALDVVDLGCGDGALTLEIARWAGRVAGVDRDEARLERARAASAKARVENVEWHRGELTALPFDEAAFDIALLSQVLHAVEEPRAAIREAVRVTRRGGRVVVLDLLPHDEVWVRDRLGHVHLGFEAEDVASWLEGEGLVGVRAEEAARRRGNPFTVLLTSGVRRDA